MAIQFKNQYEMYAWIATVHAGLQNKNALSAPIIDHAVQAADQVAMTMRARIPAFISGEERRVPPPAITATELEDSEAGGSTKKAAE